MAAPLLATDGLHVLTITTPKTRFRESARLIARQALRAALARLLAVKEGEISLISAPGTPIRLAAPWEHVGISVSHEPELSLAAIHLGGSVGIDLMRLGAPIADIGPLARDYLGPNESLAIASHAADARQLAFAKAWTRLEARLKCLTLPLHEWTPELDGQLAMYTVTELVMPDGWVATVATSSTNAAPR